MTDKTNARQPLLTAEECSDLARMAEGKAAQVEHSATRFPDAAKAEADLWRSHAARLRAGAKPPVGLTREDVERIADLLERGGTALWQSGEDADVMRECDALSARLRSISTSDRVLATYYGVEVVGPEEARPCIDTPFLCSLVTFAEDTDWGHALRVTRIHVTPTTEGDDQ